MTVQTPRVHFVAASSANRNSPEPPAAPGPDSYSGPLGRLAAAGLVAHVATLSYAPSLLQDLTAVITYGAAYAGVGLAAVGLFDGANSKAPLPDRVANGLGLATALNLAAFHACFKLTGRRPPWLGLPALGLSVLTLGASGVAGVAALFRGDPS